MLAQSIDPWAPGAPCGGEEPGGPACLDESLRRLLLLPAAFIVCLGCILSYFIIEVKRLPCPELQVTDLKNKLTEQITQLPTQETTTRSIGVDLSRYLDAPVLSRCSTFRSLQYA